MPIAMLVATMLVTSNGCREQATGLPPSRQNAGDKSAWGGDSSIGKAVGVPVRLVYNKISELDARSIATSAIANSQSVAKSNGAENATLITLASWRPAESFESGRSSVILTYIVIHPAGAKPFWSDGGRLSHSHDADVLQRWAMRSIVAESYDATYYSLLRSTDIGSFVLVTPAGLRSRLLDLNGQSVEIVEMHHVVVAPPIRLFTRSSTPAWSPLGEQLRAGGLERDMPVFIGVSESVRLETPP